jgi:hypothetical protein
MSRETFDEIDRLLVTLNSDSIIEKDIVIDTLCDYVCDRLISTEYKNKITENILKMFDPKNTYNLQESIFYFLESAHGSGVLRDKISDFMLNYMHNPVPEFIEYAMDTLMYADLISSQKEELKKLVEQCLSSENSSIQKGMLMIWEHYKIQRITWVFPSQPQTEQ